MAKNKKAVKMADIAEKLDVSVVTVSKALSGQKGVSEEVREKIIKLAEDMGYRTVSGTILRRRYNIGVLVSERYLEDYNTSFYWKMYQEVAQYAMSGRNFILFETISSDMEEKHILPGLLEEEKVDGLVVIGKPGYDYAAFLKSQVELPMVFMDFYGTKLGVDSVLSDGYYGTYALTNYLLEKGHKKIAYVGTLMATESIMDRYLGYSKALLENGISLRDDYVIEDRDAVTGMRDNFDTFQLPEDMPTAFVCNCDFTASLLIRDLDKRGYRVPADISVVGYDNDVHELLSNVKITSYAVDSKTMAEQVIQILLDRLSGDNRRRVTHIVEGYLVEKDSVERRYGEND